MRFLGLLVLIHASFSALTDKEATVLRLKSSTIEVRGKEYPYRLKVEHVRGPDWKDFNGIGALYIRKEDPVFKVTLENEMNEPTSMHPHGLEPPTYLDGVAFLSQSPLRPSQSVESEFKLNAHNQGTYFYHGHYGMHHADGLSVALIVEGQAPPGYPDGAVIDSARDVLIYVEDFCGMVYDEGPEALNPHCNNTVALYDALKARWAKFEPTFNFEACQGPLEMMDMGFRYHLINEKPLSDPTVIRAERGETLRLRIISSAQFMNYRFDFGDLNATVIATDGQWAVPHNLKTPSGLKDTPTNTLWMSPAQRYDIIIKAPIFDGVYLVKAVAGGVYPEQKQTGFLLIIGDATPTPAPDTYSDTYSEKPIWMWREQIFSAWFPLPVRPVDRELEFNITGDNGFRAINLYSWMMPPTAPLPYVNNPYPLHVKYGERVCLNINNFNPWAHPFHLHGHAFQVVSVKSGGLGTGEIVSGQMRDTVQSTKGCGTTRVCFDADHPGSWLIHCHKDLHAMAGMMTSVEYLNGQSDTGPMINPTDLAYPEWGLRVAPRGESAVANVSDDVIELPRDTWAARSRALQEMGDTTPLIAPTTLVSALYILFSAGVIIYVVVSTSRARQAQHRPLASVELHEIGDGGNDGRHGPATPSADHIRLAVLNVILALAIIAGVFTLLISANSGAENVKTTFIIPPDNLAKINSPENRTRILRAITRQSDAIVSILKSEPVFQQDHIFNAFYGAISSLPLPALIDLIKSFSADNSRWTSKPVELLLQGYSQRFGYGFVAESGDAMAELQSRLFNEPLDELKVAMTQVGKIMVRNLALLDDATPSVSPTNATDLLVTTHVLDVERGVGAGGVRVSLQRCTDTGKLACGGSWESVAVAVTAESGRASFPTSNVKHGVHRLVFETAAYFDAFGKDTLYPFIEIPFNFEQGQTHYHIPCILAPFSFQTYRGV